MTLHQLLDRILVSRHVRVILGLQRAELGSPLGSPVLRVVVARLLSLVVGLVDLSLT